jgi:hypothetical protein
MVLRNFGRGRPLNAPADSGDNPTADDFRAIYSLAERPAPSEDIPAQPPKVVSERPAPSEDIPAQPPKVVSERPAPSEDIPAQPPKVMTDFDTTRFLYRMR